MSCIRQMKDLEDFLRITVQKDTPKTFCFTGAGGKTSLIYGMAAAAKNLGKTVLVTTSTHMYQPEYSLGIWEKEAFPYPVKWIPSINDFHAEEPSIFVLGEKDPKNEKKLMTPAQDCFAEYKKKVDLLLVEADGSRGLPMKIPGEREPVIVEECDCVFGLIGLSAIDQPFQTACFRGEDREGLVSPEDFCTFMTDTQLLAKGTENLSYIGVLSQAKGREAVAEYVHSLFLSFKKAEPVGEYRMPDAVWTLLF